jgi:hypothetical protein
MTAQDAANKFQTKAVSKGLSMGPFIFVIQQKMVKPNIFKQHPTWIVEGQQL